MTPKMAARLLRNAQKWLEGNSSWGKKSRGRAADIAIACFYVLRSSPSIDPKRWVDAGTVKKNKVNGSPVGPAENHRLTLSVADSYRKEESRKQLLRLIRIALSDLEARHLIDDKVEVGPIGVS